jgi:hypothetical protein
MRSLPVVLLATCLVACGQSRPALTHAHDSAEALARAVLLAVEKRDVESLNNLAVNEREFRELVWPELPAARPERNLPFSYVWGDLHQKSDARLRQTLAKHGGTGYGLVSIAFTGGTTEYPSYRVHRDSEVVLTRRHNQQTTERLFGSVLEQRGRFKVFSYAIDD